MGTENAEERVQSGLSNELGQLFKKKELKVGWRADGQPAFKEFDAVSEDGKIIAMVKDFSATNIPGNDTRHARLVRDLYYLSLTTAQHRIMYVSPQFLWCFNGKRDAALAPGIVLREIPV